MGVIYYVMYLVSKKYHKLIKTVIDKIRNSEELSKDEIFHRAFAPTMFNISKSLVKSFKYLVILLQSSPWIIIGVKLAENIDIIWNLSNKLIENTVTNKTLLDTRKEINIVSRKYILNSKGYKRQKKHCTTNQDEKFDGLFLQDFKPIKDSNQKYSIKIKPGIYQLVGVNGVGKTTMFKSISLPEKYLVQYSSGTIMLNNKNIYDSRSISEHRNKYAYIGHLTPTVKNIELIEEDRGQYPLIDEVLQNIKNEGKEILSEGEQNISLIIYHFQRSMRNGVRMIFLDEVLSRIYEGKDKELRSELMRYIYDKTKKNNKLICIVIDHQTNFSNANKLLLTKEALIHIL